jgi:hypothetical protein
MHPLTSTDAGADLDAGDEVVGRIGPLARAARADVVAEILGAEIVP